MDVESSLRDQAAQLDQLRTSLGRLTTACACGGLDVSSVMSHHGNPRQSPAQLHPTSLAASPLLPPTPAAGVGVALSNPGVNGDEHEAAASYEARRAAKKASREVMRKLLGTADAEETAAGMAAGADGLQTPGRPPMSHSRSSSNAAPSPPCGSPALPPSALPAASPSASASSTSTSSASLGHGLELPKSSPPLASRPSMGGRSIFSPSAAELAAAAAAEAKKKRVGIYVTPAKPRPGARVHRVAAEAASVVSADDVAVSVDGEPQAPAAPLPVSVGWTIHFRSDRAPLRPAPPRVQMQLAQLVERAHAQSRSSHRGSMTPLRPSLGASQAALPGAAHQEELPANSAARKSHLRSHGQLQRNRIVQPGDEEFIPAPTEAELAAATAEATARQLFPPAAASQTASSQTPAS